MPQMSPMNWLALYLLFISLMILCSSKIHFLATKKPQGSGPNTKLISQKMMIMI